ncbi:MAG: efflux RND transporter periplasmic adaptor subunit [Gemmatimonadales bacterium]
MKRLWLSAAVLTVALGCGGAPERAEPASGTDLGALPAVRVGGVGGTATYRAAGTVRAVRRADLATRMMARIETVGVRAGDRVRAGQVLATLERGAVTAAGSQAQAGLDLATSNLRRMERLYADSAIPVAQLEAARAAFEQARGQAGAATAELQYTAITAPFAGVVTGRYADPGDLAAPGQPILVVEDASAREIVVGAPEPVADGIARGQRITVLVGTEQKPVEARVAAVVPSADPVSRTVEIRLSTAEALTANLSAIAELPVTGASAAELAVPASAVVRRGELTGVFLFTQDSTVRLRWIRLGRALGRDVAVLSGLADGDLVLRDGSQGRDGDRARPLLGGEAAR